MIVSTQASTGNAPNTPATWGGYRWVAAESPATQAVVTATRTARSPAPKVLFATSGVAKGTFGTPTVPTSRRMAARHVTPTGAPVTMPAATDWAVAALWSTATIAITVVDVTGNAASRPPIRSPSLRWARVIMTTRHGVSHRSSMCFESCRPMAEIGSETTAFGEQRPR